MPLATVALVISALVFAPLASYLAGRRARSPITWFALGVVLGPIAILLLLFAPPGRCPDCATRVRGWPRVCSSCGAALSGALTVGAAHAEGDVPAIGPADPVERPIVVRPVGGGPSPTGMATGRASASGSAGPRPVLTPLPTLAERATTIAPLGTPSEDRSWEVVTPASTPGAALAADAARARERARGRRPADAVDPDATMIGSALFLGGSAPTSTNVVRLEVGDRYGLARDGDELQILGPVTFDPERIVARVPIAGATVEMTDDRLVVRGGAPGRGTLLAFSGLAVSRGTDVVAILTAPSAGEADG